MSHIAVWLVLAIVAAIAEVLIPLFGFIFATIGALAAAAVAGLGIGVNGQLLAFSTVTVLCLVLVRPRIVAKFGAPDLPSRTEQLVGRQARVIEPLDPALGTGRISFGSEDWAARAAVAIPVGADVVVEGADGIVLQVRPAGSGAARAAGPTTPAR